VRPSPARAGSPRPAGAAAAGRPAPPPPAGPCASGCARASVTT
jgi:hypothetical protein